MVNVALNLALIPRYGMLAAAWNTAVTDLIRLLLTLWFVRGCGFPTISPRSAAAVLLAAGAAIAVIQAQGGGLLALCAVTVVAGGVLARPSPGARAARASDR